MRHVLIEHGFRGCTRCSNIAFEAFNLLISPAFNRVQPSPSETNGARPAARREPEDQHFYHEVVEALSEAREILVVGPGQAKLNLIKHMHAHDHDVENRVVGLETVDHPSDAQIVTFARKYFVAKDRMIAQ